MWCAMKLALPLMNKTAAPREGGNGEASLNRLNHKQQLLVV